MATAILKEVTLIRYIFKMNNRHRSLRGSGQVHNGVARTMPPALHLVPDLTPAFGRN